MKRPLEDEPLPEAWSSWLSGLKALISEALLPLFLLHCRRKQPEVPVASLATSLDAAGGKPLPGHAAGGVVRLLANLCPESLTLRESASPEEPMAFSFKLSAKAMRATEDKQHSRPAMCAGVVASGFSLALPPSGAVGGPSPKDAQARRWKKAQSDFYADVAVVESELNEHKARMLRQLEIFAESRLGEAPPPFSGPLAAAPARHAGAGSGALGGAVGGGGGSSSSTAGAASAASEEAGGHSSVLGFVDALQEHPEYCGQVCHVESYAARPPEYASFSDLIDGAGRPLLSAPVVDALKGSLGIDRLFTHQRDALQAVLGDRKHLCLTTGTSSGKSLAFALPILEDFRRDPATKALILFPTKALAQDQLGKLQRFFRAVCPGLGVCTFDGDTPRSERPELLKTCHVFLTNPDMLHITILAGHSRWRHVLENLRYVVLDEAHVYRSTFGSHVALLMRRLRRVVRHYGASPLFVACSATIRGAEAFFRQLFAFGPTEACAVVDDDTAGRGERRFALWNPPVVEGDEGASSQAGLDAGGARTSAPSRPAARREDRNAKKRARFREREGAGAGAPRLPPGVGYRTRASPYGEAAWILAEALRRDHRTVCFLQCRSVVELVLQATAGHLEDRADLQRRIAGYRGGYAAEDRRRLEQRLFSGELLGVVATNALELGIDIGDLDVTIHVGVPPTVESVWQQAGRAGRRGRPSAAVLVAMDAPLEQHFCRHPAEFFGRALEARVPDVANEFCLRGHVLCAASELAPLSEGDAERWFGEPARAVVADCRREGRLIEQSKRPLQGLEASAEAADGKLLRFVPTKGQKTPKDEVSLRNIDPVQFQVIVRGNATPLETLDQKMAFMRVHPGALYLNQHSAYFVEDLDLTARIAWVVPRNPKQLDYYTESREHSQVVLAGGGRARAAEVDAGVVERHGAPVVRCGAVTVHWSMYGFRKRSKQDHRLLDQIDLSLPPVEFPSQAVWMDLPGGILQPIAQAGHSVDRGGLHALEHAMIALAPACCDLESGELSCQHTRRDSDPNRYLLLLYECTKGGGGTAPKVFAQWEALLRKAVRLIEECPCESGCPNCVVIPHCGEYNHGLDKTAALKVGQALGMSRRPPSPPRGAQAPLAVGAAGAVGVGPSEARLQDDSVPFAAAEPEPEPFDAPSEPAVVAVAAPAPLAPPAPVGDKRKVGVFARLNLARISTADGPSVCLDLD